MDARRPKERRAHLRTQEEDYVARVTARRMLPPPAASAAARSAAARPIAGGTRCPAPNAAECAGSGRPLAAHRPITVQLADRWRSAGALPGAILHFGLSLVALRRGRLLDAVPVAVVDDGRGGLFAIGEALVGQVDLAVDIGDRPAAAGEGQPGSIDLGLDGKLFDQIVIVELSLSPFNL
jgi:hypothetical protein